MNGKQIGTIYFYLVSAAALALIVVGIFSSANLLINLTQYDKYPLQYLAEDCENFRYQAKGPSPSEVVPSASMSVTERDELLKDCEQRVERERKERKLDDIKNSALFTLIGAVLFFIHFPKAREQSRGS